MPIFIEHKKELGQNFLMNKKLIKEIVSSLQLSEDNILIEVGPGSGNLTDEVIKYKFKKLILIEYDEDLIPTLKENFKDVEIIQSDVMLIDFDEITKGEKYKILGALPYNISKQIIGKILKSQNYTKASLIIQKEVADKYLATTQNFLGAMAASYASFTKLFDLSPHYFHPQPKVTSTAFMLTNDKKYPDEKFVKFLKQAYINPNKTLRNNLRNIPNIYEIMKSLKIDERKRARELDLDTLHKIFTLSGDRLTTK